MNVDSLMKKRKFIVEEIILTYNIVHQVLSKINIRRISNSFEFEESYQSKQIYNIEALNDSQISFSIDDFDSDRP